MGVVSGFALTLAAIASSEASGKKKSRCLVVSSANNVRAWKGSLHRHASPNEVAVYHGGSSGSRRVQIHRLQAHGGVCLTTYGMLTKMGEAYPDSIVDSEGASAEPSWHCAVLDEAEELVSKPTGTRSRHLEKLGHDAQFLILVSGGASPGIHPIDAQARWPGMDFAVVSLNTGEISSMGDVEADVQVGRGSSKSLKYKPAGGSSLESRLERGSGDAERIVAEALSSKGGPASVLGQMMADSTVI